MIGATRPGTAPFRSSLGGGSLGVLVGRGVQMGSGFVFWVVAARTVDVADVGVAVSTTSGVLFCTQLALMGTGSAVIVQIGRGRDPGRVLDTAFSLVLAAGVLVGALFLALSLGTGTALSGIGAVALFGALVVAATAFGTTNICLDQAAIALRHPGSAMPRYSLGGALAVLAMAGLLVLQREAGVEIGAVEVFAAWTVTAVAVNVLGIVQLRRWIGYRYRPALDLAESRQMLGMGLPNQLLTLTERAPQLILPVLLAHLVAPEAAAYWYPAWMMAWIAYTAPVSVGLVQFAESVRQPNRIRQTTWSGLRWSLLLGGALAAVLAVLAGPLLHLMGSQYAEQSTAAVRILALGLVPYAVLQGYNSVCRARERLGEAIATGLVVGGVAVAVSVAVAGRGPTAMAMAWVAVTGVGAVWALVRLHRLSDAPPAVTVSSTSEVDVD